MKRDHLLSVLAILLSLSPFTTCLSQSSSIEAYYKKLEKQSKTSPQTIHFVPDSLVAIERSDNIAQIILLRHGEPALNKKGWRKRREAIAYIQAYDSVPVYPPEFIPVRLGDDELNVIYTSSINRAISTANQVFNREELQIPNPLFREFERKIFGFPNIKLPLKWWLTGSRILWFMGLNKKGIESFGEAKQRANEAATVLEEDALMKGKTLLVSHGMLNHFLVKYLKKNGWTEVFDGGKGYLSQKMLVKYQ